jgi:hypothetical protein
MRRFDAVREAVAGAFRHRLLWVVQSVANIVLFGLFAGWLLLPVASAWQLAMNAFLAIAILAGAAAIHAGTLNYFSDAARRENPPLAESLRRALRNILAVGACAAVFYFMWSLAGQAEFYQPQLPAYLRSILPVGIRRHVSLEFLQSAFDWAIFAAQWIVVPGLVLPYVSRSADLGFRAFGKSGFSAWRKAVWSVSYWVVLIVVALAGVLATQKIMGWTPDFRTSTFRSESISLALRLPLAYFLGISAWMLACSLLGRMGSGERSAG